MRTLSAYDLPDLFTSIKGATFATIVTNTDARVRASCPFGRNVRKVSRVNVTLNYNYAAAVNRQRTREGGEADFEAAPRQWGERIKGTSLVRHESGKLYLETKVERSLGCEYFAADGSRIEAEAIAPYLPSKGGSGRQEVEKPVLVRDYALDSIKGVTIKGEDFVVV
jgi:hypothetical protein